MNRNYALALAVAAVAFVTVPMALAQGAAHEHGAAQATPPATSAPASQQQQMMQRMMADMQARQQRLDEMVKQMNAATGQAKVDQIAAVVTELAAMHRMNMQMTRSMMGGGGMMPHGAAPQGH